MSPNFALHEFLITIVEDELEDQALESFVDISRVISWVGRFEPMSVDIKDAGEVLEQRPEGFVE